MPGGRVRGGRNRLGGIRTLSPVSGSPAARTVLSWSLSATLWLRNHQSLGIVKGSSGVTHAYGKKGLKMLYPSTLLPRISPSHSCPSCFLKSGLCGPEAEASCLSRFSYSLGSPAWGRGQKSRPPGPFSRPHALWALSVAGLEQTSFQALKGGIEEGTLLESLCSTFSSSPRG